MSDSNSGSVTVRFAVQDAEVVRQALDRLGKDGKAALDKLNAAGQAPTSGLKAVSAVMADLKERATGFAFSLGPLGTGMVALGPAGLIAAAALGAILEIVKRLIEGANEFAEKAAQIKAAAENIGITTDAIQALREEGAKFGVSNEDLAKGLQHFSQNMEELRQGTGRLWTDLSKLNPGLRDQLAVTRDLASAYDLFGRAINATTNDFQRNELARAAFGKGNTAGQGRLAGAIADDGGVAAAAKNAGDVIDKELIERLAKLKIQADQTAERVSHIFWGASSEPALKSYIERLEDTERLLKFIRDFKFPGVPEGGLIGAAARAIGGPPAARITIDQSGPPEPTVPLPAARPAGAPSPSPTAAVTLAQIREYMSILGPAATSTEQLKLKQAELNELVEKAGGRYGDLAARAREYYKVQQAGADLQIKVANGAASATELYAQKARELDQERVHGKLTQDEVNESLKVYGQKILPQVIEQQEVWKSSFPDLTKFAIDAANLRTQIDKGLVTGLNDANTALTDFETGAKSGKDALKDFGNQFARTALQIVNQYAILGPIAAGLKGVLGGIGIPGAPLDITLPTHHSGGIVGMEASGFRRVSVPHVADLASSYRGSIYQPSSLPRFHSGGIAPGETEAVLKNGEGVFTPGQMAALGAAASRPARVEVSMPVQIVNNAGVSVSAQRQPAPGGGPGGLRVIIDQIKAEVAHDMQRGGTPIANATATRFGLNQSNGNTK